MTSFTNTSAPSFAEWSDHLASLAQAEAEAFIKQTTNFANADFLLTAQWASTDGDGLFITSDDGLDPADFTIEDILNFFIDRASALKMPEVSSSRATGDNTGHINGVEFEVVKDDDGLLIEWAIQ